MANHVTYKIADREHIGGFLKLQERNLLANIAIEEQASGFVTTPFTVKQLERVIDEKGLFIALDNKGKLIGYIVCASWSFFNDWPIFRYMTSLFPKFSFLGEQMTVDNSYQYGPICIDKPCRGTKVLLELFAFARQGMANRYPYALTFVNTRNERSYNAHTQKLKISEIYEFSFNGSDYHLLGFPTSA